MKYALSELLDPAIKFSYDYGWDMVRLEWREARRYVYIYIPETLAKSKSKTTAQTVTDILARKCRRVGLETAPEVAE